MGMHRRGATESSASGPRGTRATRETKELNPKTRLVIRRLPPGLSSSTFHDALASKSCPCQLGTVEFVAGSESKAYMGSRYVGCRTSFRARAVPFHPGERLVSVCTSRCVPYTIMRSLYLMIAVVHT